MAQHENLFAAARGGDKGKFVEICKENVAYVTARNGNGENPFHIAAKNRILLPALKEIVGCLEEEANQKIKKAEEAKDWEKVKRLKEELKDNKRYIKEALCDKSCILHKRIAVAPLYFLDSAERKEVKQIADIKVALYVIENFICVYI